MTELHKSHPAYRRELGDGLVLRWSTAEDCERIGELYGGVFRRDAADVTNTFLQEWTCEMMADDHPLITAGDFALVENTHDRTIVAATCLLGQKWAYEEIAFPIGRPEVVASLPKYRNRGLVRAVFELIHARSDHRGDMAQGITGIPYYYRQFGYEFALDLGGWKGVPFANIPKLKEGESEAYSLRDAAEADLPLLRRLYDRERTRTHNNAPLLVTTPVDDAYWRYALENPHRASGEGWLLKVITDREGRGVGYVIVHPMRWGEQIQLRGLMVDQGVSLVAVMPSLLRALPGQAETLIKRRADIPAANRIDFGLGRAHPAYEALGDKLLGSEEPYAWYVRVPDLPAFVRHVGPVLERRLADSIMAGYSGELRLSFYRGGMRLGFENGALVVAEPWRQDHNWGPQPQAGFPPLVFLQLLFGHRSLDELHAFLPDVWAADEAKKLLNVLFPKRLSWVASLE